MIEYSVMSPSGKVCVDYYDYDTALKIYNENKELWKGYNKKIEHIHFKKYDKNNKCAQHGFINDEDFLTICKPSKCWEMWYDNSSICIVDSYDVIESEIENAKDNENEDEFHYNEIMMSEFERDLLPEFQGF